MGKNCVFLAISYTVRKKVENAIQSYLENKGLKVITGRDMASGGNLGDEIRTLIEECDFGVVVYNELRHNISYEWGLMDGMSKNVVLFKDKNTHIDLDYELSDKKATNFTPFYGEDTEEEIIQQLKEDKGLEKALEKNIEKRISEEDTPEAKKASELLAKSDLQLGELSKDIKELPNSDKILKALGKIKNLTADGHLTKGNAFYSEKKFEEALKEYETVIEMDLYKSIAYYNRGNAYHKLDKLEEALVEYNKAIEFDSEFANAYNNRGNVYFDLNKFDDAIKDFTKTIELGLDYSIAYHNRGFIYLKREEFDDAIKDFNKEIELNPECIDAYQHLAEAYILTKKHNKAFKTAQKSLEKSMGIGEIIVSETLIVMSLILQGKDKKEETELIEYINQNKGYELTFEFTLKTTLKDSKYSARINKLIKLVEENAA